MNNLHKLQELNFDVAVVGGGIAGIAAALASARQGAKTVLLEKEYALGGLATLGLVVVYLPLCDGRGTKMSAGICEELIKLSCGLSNVKIADAWTNPNSTVEERIAAGRYEVTYNQASMIILAEQLLVDAGVTILYDARMTDVECDGGRVKSVVVPTKVGSLRVNAKAFVDSTGDADVCYFAGEETVTSDLNRRTAFYLSNGKDGIKLNAQSDPLDMKNFDAPPPEGSRYYDGTDILDISQHMIDMRKMITSSVEKKRASGDESAYPLLIPTYHGFRMTRRLDGECQFSIENDHVWFSDAIGTIGNWRKSGPRYSIPYRTLRATKNANLFAAGRNTIADLTGWEIIRVIPDCAVTGEAAGVAAALTALLPDEPSVEVIQTALREKGVLLDPTMFESFRD